MSRAEVAPSVPVTAQGTACRAWNAVLVLVVAASLITQIVLLARGGADVNAASGDRGVGLAVRYVRFVSYFTVESNLLVLVLAVRPQGLFGRAHR